MNVLLKILQPLGYVIATMLILAALFVSVGRLFTPLLNEHLPDFETWSSDILKTPVKIANVHITWNLYEPELSFDRVIFLNKQTHQAKFSIQQIKVNLSIIRSLLAWKPIPESIKITGAHFTVRKTGELYQIEELKGFGVEESGSGKAGLEDVLNLIYAPPQLILKNINITYYDAKTEPKLITLEKFSLINSGNNHQLMSDLLLHQEEPTHFHAEAHWSGNVLDLQTVSADVFIYVEGLVLPQWLGNKTWQNLQIKQGVGSAKIWANWQKNQWQKIQSELQFYDLEIQSTTTKLLQKIPRFNAHLGWKREGVNQTFAGEDVLIDLPEHLWPTLRFSVTAAPNAEGSLLVRNFNIDYLNLVDIRKLALESGLLSEENKQLLIQLDPAGVMQNVQITMPTGDIKDLNNSLTAKFIDFSINPWNRYPGIKHASGILVWKPNQADLNLTSDKITITVPQVFLTALKFDKLTGEFHWQKQNSTWMLTGKNINAENPDVKGQANLSLKSTNDSPQLDITGRFSVMDVSHISNYLPLKLWGPGLSVWLRKAFVQGQIDSAKAEIHGKVADFPFEKDNGIFVISGIVKDLDLNYANDWPALREANGEIVFSGSSMTTRMNSGKILDIPVNSVTALIPYMGHREESILQVQGTMKADASQGLEFINKTPMEATLGKDLEGLDLNGPLQLKLNLLIPLEHHDKIKIDGDALLSNATLNVLEWNLEMTKLSGGFHFTENSIQSSTITGKLFEEDAALNFATVHEGKNPAYIKANLANAISINSLQNFLEVPLQKYVQGTLKYQAELKLASREKNQSTEIKLNSDLKGVAVSLPDIYGKKPDETKNLQVLMTVKSNQPTQANIKYGDAVSAVLFYKKNQEGLKFQGGEVRLGGGDARVTKEPGLLVVAQFKNLDMNTLKPYYDWIMTNTSANAAVSFNEDLFRGLELQAPEANFYGQQLKNARITISKNENNWEIAIKSESIVGQAIVAANFSQIRGKFDRLYLKSNGQKPTNIDPKSLPALSLSSADTRYENKNLGELNLVTRPSNNGLQIKQLQLNFANSSLRAEGSWELSNQKNVTHLSGNFSTSSLNQLLQQLELNTSSFIGSSGAMEFDLAWDSPPYQPSLASLSGNLSLDLKHGRIVNLSESTEAKIGLGRMLSILSLQTIPRRLSGDFSDLFQNGYNFDSMRGSFRLESGDAFTDNTRFDGPVARINIAGRIGLKARDYNLKLGITTYVSQSLVPAAVAALSPVTLISPYTAAAAWVVGALVTQPMNKVSTYQYRITGSWDNPDWEKSSAAPVTTATH